MKIDIGSKVSALVDIDFETDDDVSVPKGSVGVVRYISEGLSEAVYFVEWVGFDLNRSYVCYDYELLIID
jgi:hypothetical protein